MSHMIQCDKCKANMYADSRGNKDDYSTITTDYVDGHSTYHLCKICHRQFIVEFMRTKTPEKYDEEMKG